MGSFLPWRPNSPPQDHSDHFSSIFHSSSSSSSSLSSQSSLPSLPSLTPPLSAPSPSVHHRCLSTLRGHSSYIFSLAVSGNRLFSGASDGQIRAWEYHDSINFSDNTSNYCNCTSNVVEGCSAVKSILVSGDKLISAHQDRKIRVWKIDHFGAGGRCKLVAVLPTLGDSCMSLFSAGNYVRVRRHKRRTWVHHNDAVSSLALSPDSTRLYSVSWDRTLKIWRTSDYKCLESVQNAHDDAINAVAVAAGCVYTASADKTIKIWGIRAGEKKKHSLVATLEKHKSAVNALALSADGDVLYSGACDRSIIVWRKDGAGKMAVAGGLRGHTKAILCLATVAEFVFSGSADRTVRVWRRSESGSYSCLAAFEGHRSPVKCLAAATAENDGKTAEIGSGVGNSYLIYSGGLDFEIRVWQIWIGPIKQISSN